MIVLQCTNCKGELEHDSKYDEDVDEQVTCSCGWTSSKWTFEYIREVNEEVDTNGDE